MAGTCGYSEGLSGFINAENFLPSCKVYWLASQEGLCSMEHTDTAELCNDFIHTTVRFMSLLRFVLLATNDSTWYNSIHVSSQVMCHHQTVT